MLSNKIFIISGPSAVGKNTIVDGVKKLLPQTEETISCTTRKPRPGEKNRIHYYFLTDQEFQKKISERKFWESFEVHGMRYGTLKSEIARIQKNGKIPLLIINVNGALYIKHSNPNVILIFIKPDSWEILKKRLEARKLKKRETQMRVKNAKNELMQAKFYDYQIINHTGRIKKTIQNVAEIIKKEANIACNP